jgi:hypothetical protein
VSYSGFPSATESWNKKSSDYQQSSVNRKNLKINELYTFPASPLKRRLVGVRTAHTFVILESPTPQVGYPLVLLT